MKLSMALLLPEIRGNVRPDARSGHTAVFYRGHVIVYGGFSETSTAGFRIDTYMPQNEIWIYNIQASRWANKRTTGCMPLSGISGATACVFDDCMIIYGGFREGHGRLSEVYQLNLKTLCWRNLTKENVIHGQYPSKRDKLICWVHRNYIVYFGGFGPPPASKKDEYNGEICFDQTHLDFPRDVGWNNHICVLYFGNSQDIRWTYPETGGGKPSPRAAHAATKIGNRGYVFGGRHKDSRVNDMYYLDLEQFKWHKVEYSSPAPKGRSWHIMEKVSGNSLFVYGGLDTEGNPLSDMWLFNTTTKEWNEIEDTFERLNGQKATRIWHSAVASDQEGEVIVFGGCANSILTEEQTNHCNTVMLYRASPLTLECLCVQKVAELKKLVPKIKKEVANLPYQIQQKIYSMHDKVTAVSTTTCNARCLIM